MRRIAFALIAFGLAYGCNSSDRSGPAARLSAGASDTIIVNSNAPTPLPVRAVDAAGQVLPAAPVRFKRINGAPIPISTAGAVTCTDRGDVVVGAMLENLAQSFLVQCRPVDRLQTSGPVQFILGDSALSQPFELPLQAYGADRRRVMLIAGSVKVIDTSIAYARGDTVFPKSRGTTLVGAWVGQQSAWTGVHIYQRVDSLAALDTLLRVDGYRRQLAVPIRLRLGEVRRQKLPPGAWMLTTLSQSRAALSGLRLRFENATCEDNVLNDPGRFICNSSSGTVVILYRVKEDRETSAITAYLLVRGLYPPTV
jgi:hypothetical protein